MYTINDVKHLRNQFNSYPNYTKKNLNPKQFIKKCKLFKLILYNYTDMYKLGRY